MALNYQNPALPPDGTSISLLNSRRRMIVWGVCVVALGAIMLYSAYTAAIMIACTLIILLTPAAGWLTLALFAILSGLNGELDYMPLSLGAIDVYAMDSILVIYLWTVAHLWFNRDLHLKRPNMEQRLLVLWAIWTGLGILFLFYGFYVKHLPFDRAFGEFRRSTVYSMAFFVPLLLPFTQRQVKSLDFVILVAGLLTIAVGIARLAAGAAPRVDENWQTGHLAVRWMRMSECVTLAGLVALLFIYLRAGRGLLRRVVAVALVVTAAALLVLSGFRLAMAFIVIAPVMALGLYAWARRERVWHMVATIVVLAAAVTPLLLLIPVFLPELFDRMLLDLHLRLVNENIQGGFRGWAYRASLNSFLDSPILGQGYGYYLPVAIRNQAGLFEYVEMSNPHNMFLAVLYLTGIVGFVPFVLFHGLFAVCAVRGIRTVPVPRRRAYITLFVMYACFMACMNVQPYVSSPFILMYFMMGLMIRLARTGPNSAGANESPAT
jgi:O-antigen ligase